MLGVGREKYTASLAHHIIVESEEALQSQGWGLLKGHATNLKELPMARLGVIPAARQDVGLDHNPKYTMNIHEFILIQRHDSGNTETGKERQSSLQKN